MSYQRGVPPSGVRVEVLGLPWGPRRAPTAGAIGRSSENSGKVGFAKLNID
jgi:hypothetical protein